MEIFIGVLITIIGISIVGIIKLIYEIHADTDTIHILNEMLDKQKQLNANLEATNDVMMQEVGAWESKYNSLLYISDKQSKTIDELTEKLKYFENRYKTGEINSFVIDSSNPTQKYRF